MNIAFLADYWDLILSTFVSIGVLLLYVCRKRKRSNSKGGKRIMTFNDWDQMIQRMSQDIQQLKDLKIKIEKSLSQCHELQTIIQSLNEQFCNFNDNINISEKGGNTL